MIRAHKFFCSREEIVVNFNSISNKCAHTRTFNLILIYSYRFLRYQSLSRFYSIVKETNYYSTELNSTYYYIRTYTYTRTRTYIIVYDLRWSIYCMHQFY